MEVKNRRLEAIIHRLQAVTRTDDLTGLCNRRWLNEMLQRSWSEAVRHDRPLAFMMIDLDRFKTINDRMGHQRGDEVLCQAAKIIQTNCRQVDVVARYGGDEFCVLMPQTRAHEAVPVAQRILREYKHATRNRSFRPRRVGMSIGVADIDMSRPANAEQLIRYADEAMYAAKSDRKQRVMLRDASGICVPAPV